MSKKRVILKLLLHALSLGVIASGIYFSVETKSALNEAENQKSQTLYRFTKSYAFQTLIDEEMEKLNDDYRAHKIKHATYVDGCKKLASDEYVYNLYLENSTQEQSQNMQSLQQEIDKNHVKTTAMNIVAAVGGVGEAACLLEGCIKKKKERLK